MIDVVLMFSSWGRDCDFTYLLACGQVFGRCAQDRVPAPRQAVPGGGLGLRLSELAHEQGVQTLAILRAGRASFEVRLHASNR